MNSLNNVLIEGNLVANPEKREVGGGILCTFTVASNRYYKKDGEKKEEVSFFDVETWNKTAERCLEMLEKGRGVRVMGRLKQDRWTDKDGRKQSKVKIVGETVEFMTKFDKNPSEAPTKEEYIHEVWPVSDVPF